MKKSTTIPGAGLFYKKGAEWKARGAMRNIASAGIVKKNLNGTIAGTSSRNFLQNPMESSLRHRAFLCVAADERGQEREGVQRWPGEQEERFGEGQFRIVLPTPLGPGEYGILAMVPSDAVSTAGKMYTFRILL